MFLGPVCRGASIASCFCEVLVEFQRKSHWPSAAVPHTVSWWAHHLPLLSPAQRREIRYKKRINITDLKVKIAHLSLESARRSVPVNWRKMNN